MELYWVKYGHIFLEPKINFLYFSLKKKNDLKSNFPTRSRIYLTPPVKRRQSRPLFHCSRHVCGKIVAIN